MLTKKRIIHGVLAFCICVIFLALFFCIDSFHSHSEADDHDDCGICIWLKTVAISPSTIIIFFALFLVIDLALVFFQNLIIKTYPYSIYTHPPPYLG